MALIPYTYDPTTQDLFLYEDHTISWTTPTPGSDVVKRPYAWNPNSPLYGYRRSLHGLNAALRTLSTCNFYQDQYHPFNDPSLPENKPAFCNSWPPSSICVHPLFIWGCSHCFSSGLKDRNPSNRIVGSGGYPLGSFFESVCVFRFIRHDNQILDISPTDVIGWYNRDSSLSFPSSDPSTKCQADAVFGEFTSSQSIDPVIFANPYSLHYGSNVWYIDGSMKIIRMKCICVFQKNKTLGIYLAVVKPDGTEAPKPTFMYLHDSGSRLFIEISPPTSIAAGDGLLAAIPNHVVGGSEWQIIQSQASEYFSFNQEVPGILANESDERNPLTELNRYMEMRGYPLDISIRPTRFSSHSLQSVDDQIFILVGTEYGSLVSPTTASSNYGTFASLTSTPSNYGSFGVT